MGYRTVVILENDRSNEWMYDPELGRKIHHAASFAFSGAIHHAASFAFSGASADYDSNRRIGYGTVVECAHADVQSMIVLNGYNADPVSSSIWRPNDNLRAMKLRLLKEAAEKLGYRLIKKPEGK
jgi:hypothetical protein